MRSGFEIRDWKERRGAVSIPDSPVPILSFYEPRIPNPESRLLQHFRRERHDLHEPLAAQLARDRSEDARADRLELVVEQHGGVAVEADQRSVRAAHALLGAHDDRIVDLALLDLAARDRVADRHLDDVADARIAAL